MVFSGADFLFLFLPLFLLVQFLLPWRNITYAALSLFFYFVGEGWYTAIVMISVTLNYAAGLLIDVTQNARRRTGILAAAIGMNLAALFFFKYVGFFAQIFFGVAKDSWISSIHLPLGISFFTFHAISYLVDVYRHEVRAERSYGNLSLYMLMFPQLIAGPILRFHTVAAQLHQRHVTAFQVYQGGIVFCLCLGQKVLLADTFAEIADPLFARSPSLSAQTAWLAVIAYTLQIYFDFAGYSNMAIGLGRITGFTLPQNFDAPYIARSMTEFWQRWHMSLSRWFRDYLYIPLGGNQHGSLSTYRNLLVVFVLCGLWHGAAWTFILWGCYHGMFLVAERMGVGKRLEKLPIFARHAYTLLAIAVGWVLFRSENLDQAETLLSKMFLLRHAQDMPVRGLLDGHQLLILVLGLVFSTSRLPAWFWQRMGISMPESTETSATTYSLGLVIALIVFLASAMKILTGAYSPFIYFRF